MPLSTPPLTAPSKPTTQPLQEKPIDSSCSDIVKIALPVIAMLAAFVFLPLEVAILCTGMIIGVYIYNDGPSNKPLDKAGEKVPATPATPNNEPSNVPSTESAKKKERTPSTSARKSDEVAKSFISPKSPGEKLAPPAESKLATPIKNEPISSSASEESESDLPPPSAERFGRQARLRAKSSDDDEPTSQVKHKTPTPAKSNSVTPKTAPAQTPVKQRTPIPFQPPSTPFVQRFGSDPTAITFTQFRDDLVPLTEGLSDPTTPSVSAHEVLDPPYFSPPVSLDPVQLPKRLSLVRMLYPQYPEMRGETPVSDEDSESSSNEEISVPVKHTPNLNRSLPPLYPRSNRATEARNDAIAAKFKATPQSRKRLSGSETKSTRVSSTRTPSAKTPASFSEAENSDTPDVSRTTPIWNVSTRITPQKK